ncbi:MAG TPA: 30S ribosomal protein S12 methylthiotransferase RimO [Chloroflexota bacterium]|jgi:ribosomal protein S12 methylthiotransferase|nr:30S ribosomal protein S12 methylthiotransferase RimO [Chloroflexota bacterium]
MATLTSRRSFHIVSLGCAKNTVDSEAMAQLLLAAGHTRSDTAQQADVVVVNTCGFIESAKQESIDTLLELGSEKRPEQKLVATGCLVERYPTELPRELPTIDAFLGARNWSALPHVVSQLDELRAPRDSLGLVELAPAGALDLEIPQRKATGPSAFLKISDGCDQRCAFCAIPFMKGNHRSKPAELILREVGQLFEQGVREVVLVGQDTTRYGKDLGQRDGLATLLEQIVQRYPELPWVRVMYTYPRHITELFLNTLREVSQVLPYVDMPLQHTHPWTLARMRRPHRDVDDLVSWMRSRVPGLVLRTTFIVGFPGETEEEFAHLLDSVRRLRFDRVGVFTYSDEEGTAAFDMPARVPRREKERRQAQLMAAARQVTLDNNRRLVGSELDVLIEGRPEAGSEYYAGRSYRDAPEVDGLVLVRAERLPVGEIVRVRVEQALAYDLLARPV